LAHFQMRFGRSRLLNGSSRMWRGGSHLRERKRGKDYRQQQQRSESLHHLADSF